jgi:N-acetylglutamate synthase-like GNAT family acetyltransferase
MHGYLDQGKPFVEVSRICIDPEYRDLPTVKEFVLATIAIAHHLELDQALFVCTRSHMPFWIRMGFTTEKQNTSWNCQKTGQDFRIMKYSYADLPERILAELPPYTLALTSLTAVAA